MPITYTIFTDKKLVYSTGEGKVTFDDLVQHLEELAADKDYTSPMKKLVNYQKAQLVDITTEEVELFSTKKINFKSVFQDEMCAIVVGTEVDFGITRMHGIQVDLNDINTNSFRQIKDALTWLEVHLDENEM